MSKRHGGSQYRDDPMAQMHFVNTTPMRLLDSRGGDTSDEETMPPPEKNTTGGPPGYNQLNNGTPTKVNDVGEDMDTEGLDRDDPACVAMVTGEKGKTEKPRETWDGKIDFLLSVIGFAVDLGNVWRFPYICFRNGGGAFLIPYTIFYLIGGLPLFYLELALGQYQRCGCITVWKRICPMFKGIGLGICVIGSYTAFYYNTVISWALFYLLSSMKWRVPWDTCGNIWNSESCITVNENINISMSAINTTRNSTFDNSTSVYFTAAEEYFYNRVLGITKDNSLNNVGQIQWEIALCLVVIFTLVYFSLWKGVKSSGKAVWVTATLPYLVLFILLIVGVRLDGSGHGIKYFLKPNMTKLYELEVWTDAAAQIFFSLGPGFGVLLALSSYNKFHNNCYSDALITSAINCLTSLLAGFVVFSVLGHMALRMNKTMDKIADEGPGLVFIAYPQAIAMLTGSPFWAVLFFLMLITLGLDSTFGGLEAIITGVLDEWSFLKKRRELFVLALVGYCYVGALPTATQGGYLVLNWLDQHGAPISILFIVLCELIALCWFYGIERFSSDIESMLGFRPGIYWRVCWTFISPFFLLMMFILNVINYKYRPPQIMSWIPPTPEWTSILAVAVVGSSIFFVPLFFFIQLFQFKGSLRERLRQMITPEPRPPNQPINLINNTIELAPV